MAIIKATKDSFEKEIKEGTIIVDFYADWCGPCQQLSPILEKISNEMENVKIVKVNVDEEQEIAIKYNVMSMPTLLLLKDGELLDTKLGLLPEDDIKTWINSK